MSVLLGFGDFELDEARFELRRGGDVVQVQPKVLQFILYLAKHRERVVTKEELFRTVWDGTAVTEASLNQAVRLARKALNDSARQQRAIRTVRGRGLQFVAEIALVRSGAAQAQADPASDRRQHRSRDRTGRSARHGATRKTAAAVRRAFRQRSKRRRRVLVSCRRRRGAHRAGVASPNETGARRHPSVDDHRSRRAVVATACAHLSNARRLAGHRRRIAERHLRQRHPRHASHLDPRRFR